MPITSFHNSHHGKVLSLRNATFSPMNLSRFVWQPCQQVESLDQHCTRFIFEDRDINGYGAAYQLDDTHFRLNLIVDPNRTREGIGSLLLQRIEDEVIQAAGKYLQARLLEGMPSSLEFALARGFIQIHLMRGMSLHADDFSFSKWTGLGQRLLSRGFLVTTLKDVLEADHNALDKLASLYKLAREGWPSPDPSWRIDSSVESLRAPFTRATYPERFSIMKYKDRYVGFTSAKNLATGTGVHPGYRNLGIATYLKAYDINRCIEGGEKYFESASASEAMQRVNKKLGYGFNGVSEVRLVKELTKQRAV